MNNKTLIPTILVAVAALSGIGLVTFYDIDPKWTLLQGYALAAGTCLMLAIQLFGWARILALAPSAYLTVCILCVACFFCPTFEGANRGLSIFGHRIFHPVCLAPLVVAYLMAWHQQQNSKTDIVLASALLPALIVLAMPYLSLFVIITIIVCVLAFPVLSARPNAHVRQTVAVLLALSATLYFSPALYGRRQLVDLISSGFARRVLLAELGKCTWFGPGDGNQFTCTFSPIWNNPHVHCAYVMGLWALVAVLLAFIVLATCLYLAYRRTEAGPRKTLIRGCSVVLLVPPLFSFTRLFFAVPGHNYLMPFLSQGGSVTVSSFVALGLILAALRGDDSKGYPLYRTRDLLAFNILLALIAAFSLAIILTKHPPKPNPLFMALPPPSPVRGRILAADDSVLAYTTNHWQIRIDPQSPMGNTNVWTKPRIAAALSKELDLPYTNLIAHLNNPKNRYILLKETRDAKLIDRLSKHEKDWRLVIEKYQGRVYPLGEMAAHYVGAAGTADAFYWERKPTRGMFGVEYTQNETLADGQDIRLPLIPTLQTNLWSVVNCLKERHGADAAWGVVLTATNKTPRILAMAKCPSYDPEHYGSYREPQWENASARFSFDISAFAPYLIPSELTNDTRRVAKRLKRLELNPPVGTNVHLYASALQLARASAIVAAEDDDQPYRVTSVAFSEQPNQPVVTLLVQRDERAIVLCVRTPRDCDACQREMESLNADGLLRLQ